jgi:crotonobetainyl-CoA:carnitine CoA-transferase CaiB-like acyl-CoA transferase
VALTVRDDSDSSRLANAMGRPDLPEDHDAFDEAVAAWTRNRKAGDLVAALQQRGIPAEEVTKAERMYGLPGLDVGGFYEEFDHPVTGRHRYPGWPLRITPGPARHHRFGAPTLGQHNNEVLGGVGLSSDDLDALRRDQVIGERVMG